MDWNKLCKTNNKKDNYKYIAERYNSILNRYWDLSKNEPESVKSMFLASCDRDRSIRVIFMEYIAHIRQDEEDQHHPITCNEILRFICRVRCEFEQAVIE